MRFHFWYTALSLFFAALATWAYVWLDSRGLLIPWVPIGDFILMALAVMRLVRLFTYDVITEFIRNWFVGAAPHSLRASLGELINCPWCLGLWWALVVGFFYFATPIAWYGILVLALASIASFLQVLANLIGWSAELKKREAQSR